MTFGQQICATLIGTASGFVFALVLYFITNFIRELCSKNTLRKQLKRELQYDISLLQEWIDEIDKILRKIATNDTKVFSYLRYTFFSVHLGRRLSGLV